MSQPQGNYYDQVRENQPRGLPGYHSWSGEGWEWQREPVMQQYQQLQPPNLYGFDGTPGSPSPPHQYHSISQQYHFRSPSVSFQLPPSPLVNDQGAFPNSGPSRPAVKLPPTWPSSKRTTASQDGAAQMPDLGQQMRSMILGHQTGNNLPTNPQSVGEAAPEESTRKPKAARVRRDNQKARKHQQLESQQLLTNAKSEPKISDVRLSLPSHLPPVIRSQQQFSGQAQFLPYTGAYSPHVPPHLRGQGRPPQTAQDPMKMSRSAPQHRELYNPRSQSQSHENQSQSNAYNMQLLAKEQDQTEYIANIARFEIPRAEILQEEYDVKDQLRGKLEALCRAAIAAHESQGKPGFPAESVSLQCFGSLATTFATKNSDMDLVLLSPISTVDASSAESPLPRLVEKTFLDSLYGARLLTRTRVPIIKFCESPTPELYQKLVEARAKWEEEKDAPDVLTPSQNGKKPNKNCSGLKDHRDPTLPQNRPNSWDQPSLPSDNSPSEQHVEAVDKSHGPIATSQATAEVETHGPPVSPQASREHRVGEPKAQPALHLEGDDPSLATKSDEERVRLYRLAMKEDWYSLPERRIIVDFTSAYEAFKSSATPSNAPDSSSLDSARSKLATLPNVLRRYRPPPTKHLDYPKSGVGIQCDINFSNRLGLHNSTLLRCYAHCDPRVRPMVIFVKSWAKKRRINSAYESSLGSYGYVLMVLHYLMNIASPPVLPNLQHFQLSPEPNTPNGPMLVDGHIVHFFRDENALKHLAITRQMSQNIASIPVLLRGFFAYYGSEGWNNYHWMHDCISLRTLGGKVSKQSKGWVAAKTEHQASANNESKDIRQRYLVAIEDPFETEHNVGRTVSHDGICAIRDEFRRAHRLISHAGMGPNGKEDLLDEAEERGNLQYKYFGPNPKRRHQGQTKDSSAKRTEGGSSDRARERKKKNGNDTGGAELIAQRNNGTGHHAIGKEAAPSEQPPPGPERHHLPRAKASLPAKPAANTEGSATKPDLPEKPPVTPSRNQTLPPKPSTGQHTLPPRPAMRRVG